MGWAMSYNFCILILYVFLNVGSIMKLYACEQCGIMCKKGFNRAFCSVKCRFWGYIIKNPDPECWIWNGKRDQDGYGAIMINGKRVRAHRFSYELHSGPIAIGKLVLHSCHKPLCVNPGHLREGTVYENSMDMVRAKRDMYGERGTASKLKEEDIKEIRRLYSSGCFSQQEIAYKFSVSQVAIGAIVRNKTWKHVKS